MNTEDEIYLDKDFYDKHKNTIDEFVHYANLGRIWNLFKLERGSKYWADHTGQLNRQIILKFDFGLDPFNEIGLNNDGSSPNEIIIAKEIFNKWNKRLDLNDISETQKLWKQLISLVAKENQEIGINLYDDPAVTKYFYRLLPKNIINENIVKHDPTIRCVDTITKHFYVVNGTSLLLPLLDLR